MEVTLEMYALVGILIGVLIRTFLPYFEKLEANPGLLFDWRYVITAGLSAVITAFILMPLFTIPEASRTMIVLQAAVFAFTSQEILNAYSKTGSGAASRTVLSLTNKEAKIARLEAKLVELKKAEDQPVETTVTVVTPPTT
jgi:hypothetical protein